MDAPWLSDAANVATVVGVTTALLTAVVVIRDWRHKTRHRLYIPDPNFHSQDPEDPEFWVFPPEEFADGSFGVVIAGKIFNAGPSDAFSVRIWTETEDESADFVTALFTAIARAVNIRERNEKSSKGHLSVECAFFEAYKTRRSLIPVIPVGEARPFVVMAVLEPGDAFLDLLLRDQKDPDSSLFWEVEGRQVHGIHARSRTALGRQLSFGPEDLCAPFEKRRWRDALRRIRRKLDRES